LNRRAFPSEGDAAGERGRATEEFAGDGAEEDAAVIGKQSELRLRDAAAAGERKKPP
jgi:hypothetical protein